MSKGIQPETIHLAVSKGSGVGFSPHVHKFIKGAGLLRLPPSVCDPSWDLPLVLHHLARPPFEPYATCAIELLTLKTAFLTAIISDGCPRLLPFLWPVNYVLFRRTNCTAHQSCLSSEGQLGFSQVAGGHSALILPQFHPSKRAGMARV